MAADTVLHRLSFGIGIIAILGVYQSHKRPTMLTNSQAENPSRTVRTMPWVARWREPGLQAEQEKRQLAGRLTTLLELRLRGG